MYSGPRYASETSYYKKRKNEQDDVNNNEKLVKKNYRRHFSGIFRRATFLGEIFRG